MTTKTGAQKTKYTQNWVTKNVWLWQVATFPFLINKVMLHVRFSVMGKGNLILTKNRRTNTQRYLDRRKYICNRQIGHYSIFRSFSSALQEKDASCWHKLSEKNFPAHNVCGMSYLIFIFSIIFLSLSSRTNLQVHYF